MRWKYLSDTRPTPWSGPSLSSQGSEAWVHVLRLVDARDIIAVVCVVLSSNTQKATQNEAVGRVTEVELSRIAMLLRGVQVVEVLGNFAVPRGALVKIGEYCGLGYLPPLNYLCLTTF